LTATIADVAVVVVVDEVEVALVVLAEIVVCPCAIGVRPITLRTVIAAYDL